MYFLVLLLILAIDFATKYIIRLYGGFYICNQGISWGLLLPKPLFWTFWLISAIIILTLFFRSEKRAKISLIIILGGSMANVLERVWHGCVSDFLTFPIISFPSFNMADITITLGALMFLYYTFSPKRS